MLRFISKVAFLASLFLIPVWLIHYVPALSRWDAGVISHMVITVYFIALPLNLLIYLWLLVLVILKKKSGVPQWQQIANGLFLIAQLYYFQFT